MAKLTEEQREQKAKEKAMLAEAKALQRNVKMFEKAQDKLLKEIGKLTLENINKALAKKDPVDILAPTEQAMFAYGEWLAELFPPKA